MKTLQERFKFWLCVTFLMGVGVFLAFTGWSNLALTRVLAREGVTTVAKVLDHSSESYSRRSSNLKLTVEYSPTNHPTVTKTISVSGHVYHPAVKAGTVEIRYLPSQPERFQAEEWPAELVYIIGGLGTIMVIAATLLLVFYGPSMLAGAR